MRAMFLCVLLTGCIEAPPTTATDEQAVCNPNIDDCPGGHPIHCTPLGSCTDANFQNGTCCQDFGYPGTPSPVPNSIHCGYYQYSGQAYCTAANEYWLWDHIICVTTTVWTNGEAQAYTSCYVAAA